MPTNTYVALDTTTVVTATPSITFSNISQAYTDLVVVMTGTIASGGAGAASFQFNGDTSSTNYSNTRLYGDGTNAASTRNSNQPRVVVAFFSDSLPSTNIVSIMNYANSTTYKTCVYRNNASDNRAQAGVGLWRSTSAINEILITNSAGLNFTVGTTFSLYGIKSWSDEVSPKATGGYVYEDSSYWYHSFPFSGTFTPSQNLTDVDYLVIAGGGGSGRGGGGAGGLRSTVTATGGGGSLESKISLTSGTTYTVTVGAGGSYGNDSVAVTNGGNSSISGTGLTTITSIGGGAGGRFTSPNGALGGSGGGGESSSSAAGTGGAGTANQGYAGGSAGTISSGSAGGGGAGGAGTNGSSSGGGAAGNGGNGVAIPAFAVATNTGVSNYYAGGGAGGNHFGPVTGTAGLGGGGAAGTYDAARPASDGKNGTVSTGGGGGGGSGKTGVYGSNGGNGASGIVIVRYAK